MSHSNPYQIPIGLSSLVITTNSGSATPNSSGSISVIGSGNITTSASGNQVTVSLVGSGLLSWSSLTSSVLMSPNHGYIVISGALTLQLPASSAVGDQIRVLLNNGGTSWSISQAIGQSIAVANKTTTIGSSGSVSSTAPGNSVLLICTYPNIAWQVVSDVGNLNVI